MQKLWQKSATSQLQTLRPSQPPDYFLFEKYWDMVMADLINKGRSFAPLFKVMKQSNILRKIEDRITPAMESVSNKNMKNVSDALGTRLMRRLHKARELAKKDPSFYNEMEHLPGFSHKGLDIDHQEMEKLNDRDLASLPKPSHPYFDTPNDPLEKSDVTLSAQHFTLHGYLLDSLVEVDTDNEDEIIFQQSSSPLYFKQSFQEYHHKNPDLAATLVEDSTGSFSVRNPFDKQGNLVPLPKQSNKKNYTLPQLLAIPQVQIKEDPKTYDELRAEFELKKVEEASQSLADFDLAANKIAQIVLVRMHLDGVKLSDPSKLYNYMNHYVKLEPENKEDPTRYDLFQSEAESLPFTSDLNPKDDQQLASIKNQYQSLTSTLSNDLYDQSNIKRASEFQSHQIASSLHDDVAKKYKRGLSDPALTPRQKEKLTETLGSHLLETRPGTYAGLWESPPDDTPAFGLPISDTSDRLSSEIRQKLDSMIRTYGIPFEPNYSSDIYEISDTPDPLAPDQEFQNSFFNDSNGTDSSISSTTDDINATTTEASENHGFEARDEFSQLKYASPTRYIPTLQKHFAQFAPTANSFPLEDVAPNNHISVQDSAEALVSGHHNDISGAYSAVLVTNPGDLLSLHGADGRFAEQSNFLPGLTRLDSLYESLLGPLWGQFIVKVPRHNLGEVNTLKRGRIAGPEGALLARIYSPKKPMAHLADLTAQQNEAREKMKKGSASTSSSKSSSKKKQNDLDFNAQLENSIMNDISDPNSVDFRGDAFIDTDPTSDLGFGPGADDTNSNQSATNAPNKHTGIPGMGGLFDENASGVDKQTSETDSPTSSELPKKPQKGPRFADADGNEIPNFDMGDTQSFEGTLEPDQPFMNITSNTYTAAQRLALLEKLDQISYGEPSDKPENPNRAGLANLDQDSDDEESGYEFIRRASLEKSNTIDDPSLKYKHYSQRLLTDHVVNYDSSYINSFPDSVDEHGNPSRDETRPAYGGSGTSNDTFSKLPQFSFLNESGFSAAQHVAPLPPPNFEANLSPGMIYDLPVDGSSIPNPESLRKSELDFIRRYANNPELAIALSNRKQDAKESVLKFNDDIWHQLMAQGGEVDPMTGALPQPKPVSDASETETSQPSYGNPLQKPYFGDFVTSPGHRKIDREFSSKMISWGGLFLGGGDAQTRKFATTQELIVQQLRKRGFSDEDIRINYDIEPPPRQFVTGVYEDEVEHIRDFDKPSQELLQEREEIRQNDTAPKMTELSSSFDHYPPTPTEAGWAEFKDNIHAHFAYWVSKGFSPSTSERPPRPPQHWIENFHKGSQPSHANLLQDFADNPNIKQLIQDRGKWGAEIYEKEGYINNKQDTLEFDGDFQMPDYMEYAMSLVAPADIVVHDTKDAGKWYFYPDKLFKDGIFYKGLSGRIPYDWNIIGQRAALIRTPSTWIFDWMRDFALGTMDVSNSIQEAEIVTNNQNVQETTSETTSESKPLGPRKLLRSSSEPSAEEFYFDWAPNNFSKKSHRMKRKAKVSIGNRIKYMLGPKRNPNYQWISPMMEARNNFEPVQFDSATEIPGTLLPDGQVNPGKQLSAPVLESVFKKPILLYGDKGTGKSQILNQVAAYAHNADWVTFFVPHVSAMAGFTVKKYLKEREIVPISKNKNDPNFSPYSSNNKGQGVMESDWDTAPMEGSIFHIGDNLDEYYSESNGLFSDDVYAGKLLERFLKTNRDKLAQIPIHDLDHLQKEFYFSNADGSITPHQKKLLDHIAAYERMEAAEPVEIGANMKRFWSHTYMEEDSDLTSPDVDFGWDKVPYEIEFEIGHAPPKTLLEFVEWAIKHKESEEITSTSVLTRAYRAVIHELQLTSELPVIFIVDDWNVISVGKTNILDPYAYQVPGQAPKKGKNPRARYSYLPTRYNALLEPFADPQTFCKNSKRSLLVCATTDSVPHNPTTKQTFESTPTGKAYRDKSFHSIPVLNYSLEEFGKVVNFYHQKELTTASNLDVTQDPSYLGRLYNITGGKPSEVLPTLLRGFDSHPIYMNKLRTHENPGSVHVGKQQPNN